MGMQMGLMRVFTAGVLAAAVAGCRPSAIYVPAVEMHALAQPTEVHGGDTVRIAVIVTNPRPDTVLLDFGIYCRVGFTARDEVGRVVSPEVENSYCLFPTGGQLVLPPGGTWRVDGAWRASRDNGDPIPAGSYTIAAGLGDHDSTVRGKRQYKVGAGADPVPIRVLPPRP